MMTARENEDIQVVKQDNSFFETLPEERKTEAVSFEAVKAEPSNFVFVPPDSRSERVKQEAISRDGLLISRIEERERTFPLCKAAIKGSPLAYEYLPAKLKTENNLVELVADNPFILCKLKEYEKTEKLCRTALAALPDNLKPDLLVHVPFSDVCFETLQTSCKSKADAAMYAISIPDKVMNENIASFLLEKNPFIYSTLKDISLSPKTCLAIERAHPDYFINNPSALPMEVRESANVFTLSRMLERICGQKLPVEQLEKILNGEPLIMKNFTYGGKHIYNGVMQVRDKQLFIVPKKDKEHEKKETQKKKHLKL